MSRDPSAVEVRIAKLERSLYRTRVALGALCGCVLLAAILGFIQGGTQTFDEIRTRRLAIVDERGLVRIVLAQDPPTTERMSRGTGLTLMDEEGNERGGFSTMEDGSVVLGMDAPLGVGAPMRDRIGLKVHPDGSAYVMLIDNLTRAVARLHSDSTGGGVQVFKWDMASEQVHIRTLTFDGDVRESIPFGH